MRMASGGFPGATRGWLVSLLLTAGTFCSLRADDSPPRQPPAVRRAVSFQADVLPILRQRCFECHAQGNEEGGLNLALKDRALKGGMHGVVLKPGRSGDSVLIQRVASQDPERRMPPEGEPLTVEQIDILRAWIDQGLNWPADADVLDPRMERARGHWAFQPLRDVKIPDVRNAAWCRNDIDRFVLAQQESQRLSSAPPLDATRLIRRMTLDVTGLPPDITVVRNFERQFQKEGGAAVEALAEHLLAERHFGERWARHWLDVARYADSDGQEGDKDRPHAWHYRDFVIRAFHEDLPFHTFVRWQIAGDEYEPDNAQAVAATGFLVAGPNTVLEDTFLEEERLRNRYNELDDMLSTIGTGLLGLTFGCARCHDHKYDAIQARDYYSMLSALHNGDRKEVKLPGSNQPALVFSDFGPEANPTWLFSRGDFYDRTQPVSLNFPIVLSSRRTAEVYWQAAREQRKKPDSSYQRKALAEWLTDVEHGAGPLLARVIVNRIWQHHFGEGLVRTVSDFGVRGEAPSHPDLLEWLARDFISNGWKLKRLHRQILTSAAYSLGPAPSGGGAGTMDPSNRWLSYRSPRRLEAEVIRDAMLAASGTLNLEPYGPPFKPQIAGEAMVARNLKSAYPKEVKDSADVHRRTIYMFHKRVIPYPLLQAFDRPDSLQSCGRRETTTVAPQALALLNDDFVRARSLDFATRLLQEAGGGEPDLHRIAQRGFELTLSRTPDKDEQAVAVEFLASQMAARKQRAPKASTGTIRRQAVADFCQSLFGLNEFAYVD